MTESNTLLLPGVSGLRLLIGWADGFAFFTSTGGSISPGLFSGSVNTVDLPSFTNSLTGIGFESLAYAAFDTQAKILYVNSINGSIYQILAPYTAPNEIAC